MADVQGSAPDSQPSASQAPSDLVARIVAAAARSWGTSPSQVAVTGMARRTWPDARLGCLPDRRGAEPSPIGGWEVVVQAGTRAATFHTEGDRRFVECPAKRRGPIN